MLIAITLFYRIYLLVIPLRWSILTIWIVSSYVPSLAIAVAYWARPRSLVLNLFIIRSVSMLEALSLCSSSATLRSS
jgi:hypothetical protein